VSDLADLRLAIAGRRHEREAARRARYDVQSRLQQARFEDSQPFGDHAALAVTIAQLQADVAAAEAAVEAADTAHRVARENYDAAAADEPALWEDDGDVPLLLLPVRMEAVFAAVGERTELWLRVYPDDVHVDVHEPALTDAEREAGERYWADVPAGGDRDLAWRTLLAALGLSRAAWALEALRPGSPAPASRPGTWTRAGHTTLLPDRFVFSAYQQGRLAWRHEGAAIPDVLPIGLAPPQDDAAPPPDGLPWDEHSRWLVDFEEAVRVGMGKKVRLEHPEETFDLLTVVGVITGDEPDATAARWHAALQAHQFTDGLAVLPAGTPTNNTPATRSGWRSRPDPRPPEAVDALREAFDPSSRQPAARAARAFGTGGELLAVAPDALAGDDDLVAATHAAAGRYVSLSRMWRPLATRDAPEGSEGFFDLTFLVDHFAQHVRSRGPLPTLRIGRQPYGVLPAASLDLWRGDDVDGRILDHVASFVTALEERIDRVPLVAGPTDQDRVILDLLSREPASRRVSLTFQGEDTFLFDEGPPERTAVVGSVPLATTWGQLRADTIEHARMVVDEDPPEELRRVAALRPLAAKVQLAEDLRVCFATEGNPGAVEIFDRFEVLRTALAPLERWEGDATTYTGVFYPYAEDVSHYLFNIATRTSDPGRTPEQRAAWQREYDRVKQVCDELVGLEALAATDVGGLEKVLCEVLDTLAHRVDAWATSVATARLSGLRAARPGGLRVGAYGWLTDVGHGHQDPTGDGYVITPSIHHATTAAVLRSGFRAHTDRRALAVDLQSSRVRTALKVIDGVRTGQTLGALLGYQFERGLHDAGLDRHIAGFRHDYPLPLVVDDAAPGAAEARVAIGVRNVVDGQTIRKRRPDLTGVPAGDRVVIERLLADLDDSVDAVADLLLAESVHHLVGGSPLRAGLSADAIGRGDGLPSEFDVVRTPRSASASTYHLGLLGRPGAGGPAGWNDARALARLEPAVESWCRFRLGAADGWRFLCRVDDAEREVSLASLGWCALDLLTAAQPATGPSPLRRRLLEGGAALTDAGAARLDELMLLAGQLRAVLAAATPLLGNHLDPTAADGWAVADVDEFAGRVRPWVDALRAARSSLAAAFETLRHAGDASVLGPPLAALEALGLVTAQMGTSLDIADQVTHLLTRLDALDLDLLDPPAGPAVGRWAATAAAVVAGALGRHVTVVPVLRLPVPAGAPAGEAMADWLRGVTPVRPAAAGLDDAVVAASVLAGGDAGGWTTTAWPAETAPSRTVVVLHHDGAAAGPTAAGLIVDSWTEAVPRGNEEVAGVAFNYDRPGSAAPQAMMLAVPPDPARGWRIEDVHGVVEDTFTLARIRSLDLRDVPELRNLLPAPGAPAA
jgi:hypothetical protein